MALDLALSVTRDLSGGFVTKEAETMQRLITRLRRELGEWFLDTEAGIPWFQEGAGLLGSKRSNILTLLLRKEALGTEGITRVLKLNALYDPTVRTYSIYMQVLLDSDSVISFR